MDINMQYNASLTSEQFLFYEIRIVSRQYLEGKLIDEIIEYIKHDNLFQYPTERKISELARACNLQRVITKYLGSDYPWIITYDDCLLVRSLYHGFHKQVYGIAHNAGGTVPGKEIVITNLPINKFIWY